MVVGAYAPSKDKEDEVKDKFYDELTDLVERVGARKELLLLDDLNTRTRKKENDKVIGQFGEETETVKD